MLREAHQQHERGHGQDDPDHLVVVQRLTEQQGADTSLVGQQRRIIVLLAVRRANQLSLLAARLKDKQTRERQAKEAATRKSLIGSGDRSDRIRTYNFPQGRVTDHRINLTLYKIGQVMDGELDELVNALIAEHQTEQLAALAEETAA